MDNREQEWIEEYKFLRQEHENNRKFVFERPLVIVGGMIAASMGFKGTLTDMLGLLPILLLSILWFNLWFTHNRLQSSARIVAYIQIAQEPQQRSQWIGWENALVKYRKWTDKSQEIEKQIAENTADYYDSMGFYSPIFFFHLLCGVLFVPLTLMQYGSLDRYLTGKLGAMDFVWTAMNVLALLVFTLALIPYRPEKVKKAIEIKRRVWDLVLETEKEPEDRGKHCHHSSSIAMIFWEQEGAGKMIFWEQGETGNGS